MTLPICLMFADTALPPLDAASQADLQALAAEAMGWQPLEQGAYLHHGDAHGEVQLECNWGQSRINLSQIGL